MKVLFIGGNGNISWYCQEFAIRAGHEVYLLTRGETLRTRRKVQEGVRFLKCDIRDHEQSMQVLKDFKFDVVCDFICYDETHAAFAFNLFRDKVKQYIFISSVVVYRRETRYLPFKEDTPQWKDTDYDYALGKIRAERCFLNAHREHGFPITIIRPAHTYDTIIPVPLGHNCYTAPRRYLDGKPVLIAGDGTNLWSLCHSSDFARGFIGLIGNSRAIGEDFHIAGEEWLTWLDIADVLLDALGVQNAKFIHIPANEILKIDLPPSKNMAISYLGKAFRGQRMWCDLYDNSKIKSFVPGWGCEVPFHIGIRETLKWLDEDPIRKRINQELDALMEHLTIKYGD